MIFCRNSIIRAIDEILVDMKKKNFHGVTCRLNKLKRELKKVNHHPGRRNYE